MTRIDLIDVREMSNQHIISGNREIKRIPNKLKNGKYKNLDSLPSSYRLGAGHERFFVDKLKFLHKRYIMLYAEGIKRGLNISNYEDAFKDIPKQFYNDWIPSQRDILTNQQRVSERLLLRLNKGFYRWSTSSLCYTNKEKKWEEK